MNVDYNALKNMSVDALRQRITVFHPVYTYDDEGHQEAVYGASPDDKTIWASVRAYAAVGAATDTEERNETTYVVIVRYSAAIYAKAATECRIMYNGMEMAIISPLVDADGRHQWVSMQCRLVTADNQIVGGSNG